MCDPIPRQVWVPPNAVANRPFLLGLSAARGQDASCWPSPCQCHIGVVMSGRFLLLQAAPRESFQAQKIRMCPWKLLWCLRDTLPLAANSP